MKSSVIGLAAIAVSVFATGLPIGEIDTIGGSTYDCSTICAGLQRLICFDPGYGIHVAWFWSVDRTSSNFNDRNVRYNYYDLGTRIWNWIEPDYMSSGMNVFQERSGYGAIDVDPNSHVVVISRSTANQTPAPMHPDLARDLGPGQGSFEYCEGTPLFDGYQWPWHSVSASGAIHLFAITPTYSLMYAGVTNWPTWGPLVTGFIPDPGFPTLIITASKRSGKVAPLWENQTAVPGDAYYSMSTDDGATWDGPINLQPPVAFDGDTVTSFHISSFGAMFDRDDNLNLVAAVMPIVRDTGSVIPAEIWHYNAGNTTPWHEIHRAGGDPASVGYRLNYTSLYACRPKIGQDPTTGRLCVIWSQYDTANVEPATDILRADVWCSTSPDGGYTWSPAVNLTGPDSCSRMYCDIAPIVNDTMHIAYMSDLQAGQFVLGQGTVTDNPIIYMKVPVSAVAVEERQQPTTGSSQLAATVIRGVLTLSPATILKPQASSLLDAAGRKVMDLRSGANDVSRLPAGVYFLREAQAQAQAQVVHKVVVQR